MVDYQYYKIRIIFIVKKIPFRFTFLLEDVLRGRKRQESVLFRFKLLLSD